MTMPEHVRINRGVGITLPIYEYDIERLYTTVRDSAKTLNENGAEYYDGNYSSYSHDLCVVGMWEMGFRERAPYTLSQPSAVVVELYHHFDQPAPWEYKDEVVLKMKSSTGVPCILHYNVAYAVVSKEDGKNYKKISIAFYNEKDEHVITLRQYQEMRYGEVRCKAGKYVLSAEAYKERAKKEVAGGCFFCDYARYEKENGIVYIACDKYKGRVTEVEYEGETYPVYCKRRV